jgi:hypothetical protein
VSVHRKPRALRRRRSSRKPLLRVLIVGEGRETERNYFDALKREDEVRAKFFVTVRKGKGGSREQIAQHAVERKREAPDDYDVAFCVMDVEHAGHAASLKKALTLLRRNHIAPCLSNPSFEIWLNAHFERTSASFKDGDAAVQHLNVHWKKYFRCDYDKAHLGNYSRLMEYQAAALKYAKEVRETDHGHHKTTCECNSSTDVYRLVRWLLGGPSWDA